MTQTQAHHTRLALNAPTHSPRASRRGTHTQPAEIVCVERRRKGNDREEEGGKKGGKEGWTTLHPNPTQPCPSKSRKAYREMKKRRRELAARHPGDQQKNE